MWCLFEVAVFQAGGICISGFSGGGILNLLNTAFGVPVVC